MAQSARRRRTAFDDRHKVRFHLNFRPCHSIPCAWWGLGLENPGQMLNMVVNTFSLTCKSKSDQPEGRKAFCNAKAFN